MSYWNKLDRSFPSKKPLERKWRATHGKEHVYQFHYTCQASKNSTLCVIREKKMGREPELVKARKQKHKQCKQPSDCHITWERLWGEKHDCVLLTVDLSSWCLSQWRCSSLNSMQRTQLWFLGFPDKWKKMHHELGQKGWEYWMQW